MTIFWMVLESGAAVTFAFIFFQDYQKYFELKFLWNKIIS